MKKNTILALLLSSALVLMPLVAAAQDVSGATDSAPSDVSAPVDSAPTPPATDASTDVPTPPATDANTDVLTPPDTQTVEATTTDIVISDVQDATSSQPTATADVLEATADPQATSTLDEQTVVLDATSTRATSTDTVVLPDTQIVVTPDQNDPPQDVAPIEAQPQLDVVAQSLPIEAEATSTATTFVRDVDPDFVIALSGKTIPTERKDTKSGKTLQTISAPVNAAVDSSTGDVHLSGSCSNTYFVVLLFRHQDDYATDPRSFILNKAFPCENGQYSYAVSDLPPTLANGTYYLLVGEQGDVGSWKPITSLTEVEINRN